MILFQRLFYISPRTWNGQRHVLSTKDFFQRPFRTSSPSWNDQGQRTAAMGILQWLFHTSLGLRMAWDLSYLAWNIFIRHISFVPLGLRQGTNDIMHSLLRTASSYISWVFKRSDTSFSCHGSTSMALLHISWVLKRSRIRWNGFGMVCIISLYISCILRRAVT